MTADPIGSSKDDIAGNGKVSGATTATESAFAELLAAVVEVDHVSVDSNFFDDLNADSMVMARFCARVRKRPDLPSVSMKDIYRYPTIRSLAAALAPNGAAVAEPAGARSAVPASSSSPAARQQAAIPTTPKIDNWRYVLCGAAQLLVLFTGFVIGAVVVEQAYLWIMGAVGIVDSYLRALAFSAVAFAILCAFPIAMKWILIGRWKPREFPVWGLTYFRFWLVKTLIRANPLVLLAVGRSRSSTSSPLYLWYLRALGAKIGKNVTIYSRIVPVCTDLITIGDGTVVRKDAIFLGYRAYAGRIQTGSVTLGKDVFVGEGCVLDIDTAMGDGAELGHASSLQTGQTVPAGECWHGSPAQPAQVSYRRVPPAPCGVLRRAMFGFGQLATMLGLWLPIGFGMAAIVLDEFSWIDHLILDTEPMAFTTWTFYRDVLLVASGLYFGAILTGLIGVAVIPRLLNLAIKPGRVYRLYGFHYWVHRSIAFISNRPFYLRLFGDSSYIVHYLKWIGYDLSTVEQTGSNFGTDVRHETPFHVKVGSGTMVADGLSVMNAEFSNSSFQLTPVTIGARNFLGNNISYPSDGKTGDNCLLATKVMIPIDGPVRRDTGLLGAPSFPIPRSVERDGRFDHLHRGAERKRRLAMKNKYNIRTMVEFVLLRWIFMLISTCLVLSAADFYRLFSVVSIAVQLFIAALLGMAYFILLERAVLGFRRLEPQFCSIYHPYFWWHERYWKNVAPPFDIAFAGTPLKNVVSRLLGVRTGKRVFDDGATFTERTLVSIGDECTLNQGSGLQCHSQEDGTFKSDYTKVGSRCTLGVGAFIHYGVTVGDDAIIAAHSFVMKGEDVPPGAHWAGNPARDMAPVPPRVARVGIRRPKPRPTTHAVAARNGGVIR